MVVKRAREKASVESSPSRSPKKKATTVGGNLDGLKIVVTGETEILGRSILESKLKDAGASVTSAVSGVTNILIYGPKLEDGRPTETSTKYRKALELMNSGKSKVGLRVLSEQQFYEEFPNIGPAAVKVEATSDLRPSNPTSLLWAERWRPVDQSDFSVNINAYLALADWLIKWKPSSETERGCLLTGPPGIGKTSAAIAVARNEGYELLEFNASDTRSKKRLEDLYPLLWGGCTLRAGQLNSQLCLLMDEADGLSAGDRGGSDTLCRMIKTSSIPIIATCNDKQHPKVKTLSKYCRVINFEKPSLTAAVARCKAIAKAEGYEVPDSVIQNQHTATNGDMRALLNGLQAYCTGTQSDGKNVGGKDMATYDDVFAITRKLFVQAPSLSVRDCLRYFFFDYEMVPVVVHENAAKSLLKNKDESFALRQCAEIYDGICMGDRIMNRIKGRNQWELLPDAGLFSAVIPAKAARATQMFRADFPSLLGKISAGNKKKRQMTELRALTGIVDGVTDGMFELLGDWILQPLVKSEDIDECLSRADTYHLADKELLTETLMNVRHPSLRNPYDAVATKSKTRLTKAFASRDVIGQKKKRAKGVTQIDESSETSDSPLEQDIADDLVADTFL